MNIKSNNKEMVQAQQSPDGASEIEEFKRDIEFLILIARLERRLEQVEADHAELQSENAQLRADQVQLQAEQAKLRAEYTQFAAQYAELRVRKTRRTT